MSGSIPIQIRGTPGTGPPVGLQERQLAVEMNNGNLWVGVPVSIDSTGRVMLNPNRVPSGGNPYDVVTKGAGTTMVWSAVGDRPGNSTAGGWAALNQNPGTNNTAWGNSALRNLTTGNYNVAVGNNALTNAVSGSYNVVLGAGAVEFAALLSSGTFIGYGATPGASPSAAEIVIGANATGHGSQTATIGADSGPAAMTQLWCGGRDLLAVGQPPPFGPATGNLTGLANDGAVHDVVSCLLSPGLWIILVRTWLRTATSTPWFIYGAGLNTAPGQTTIGDTTAASTTAGSVTSASFNHIDVFRATASGTIYGCVMAQNATNSGTYDTSITLEPWQLST